ncbi:hypothetical protein S83_029296, partial [Arachis hypogaea]
IIIPNWKMDFGEIPNHNGNPPPVVGDCSIHGGGKATLTGPPFQIGWPKVKRFQIPNGTWCHTDWTPPPPPPRNHLIGGRLSPKPHISFIHSFIQFNYFIIVPLSFLFFFFSESNTHALLP